MPDAGGAPLEATVITRLTDGSGRPTERRLTAAVRPSGPVTGIRPLFDDSVPEGAEAAFTVIGLSVKGPDPGADARAMGAQPH